MKPDIELHIEELVLHGFRPSDRHRIGEELQLELARLLREKDMPSLLEQGGEYPRINSGTIKIGPVSDGRHVGRRIADAVYESLHPIAGNKGRLIK
jgi:hypothetical protein